MRWSSGVLWVAVMGALGCGAAPAVSAGRAAPGAGATTRLDWWVEVAPAASVDELAVALCFAGALPPRLLPGVPEAAGWLRSARVRGGVALAVVDGGLSLPAGRGCVDYVVDLRAAAERGSSARVVRASPGHWLWRPARLPGPDRLRVMLRARLPEGMALSLAWPRVGGADAMGDGMAGGDGITLPAGWDDGSPVWWVPWNGLRYRSDAVIGWFLPEPLAGGALSVVWLGVPEGGRARFRRWLEVAAGEVAAVFGRFPVPGAQVVVVFEGGDEVGFGATARGGGPGVVLYVGRAADRALRDDWTATHELFHLGMPLIRQEDAWLSEGVTTVWTYIAMGRGGRLSAVEVFEELVAGFRRGAAWGTGRPLGEESAAMHETRAYWRVYWGGGAWALGRMAAMAAAGRRFEEVLGVWARWNADPGPAKDAMVLMRAADEAVPGFGFAESAAAALGSSGFPAWEAALGALGVEVVGRGVRLTADGAAARARVLGASR